MARTGRQTANKTLNKYLILAGGRPEAGWAAPGPPGVTLRARESELTKGVVGGGSLCRLRRWGEAGQRGHLLCPCPAARAPVAPSAAGPAPPWCGQMLLLRMSETEAPRAGHFHLHLLPGGDPCGLLSRGVRRPWAPSRDVRWPCPVLLPLPSGGRPAPLGLPIVPTPDTAWGPGTRQHICSGLRLLRAEAAGGPCELRKECARSAMDQALCSVTHELGAVSTRSCPPLHPSPACRGPLPPAAQLPLGALIEKGRGEVCSANPNPKQLSRLPGLSGGVHTAGAQPHRWEGLGSSRGLLSLAWRGVGPSRGGVGSLPLKAARGRCRPWGVGRPGGTLQLRFGACPREPLGWPPWLPGP